MQSKKTVPIKTGAVIISDVLHTGIDIVATRDLPCRAEVVYNSTVPTLQRRSTTPTQSVAENGGY